MDTATVAGIVAIITALAGAITTVITALKTGKKVTEVHALVNGTTTVALARNEQLTAALTEANVLVPPSPTVTPPAV